MNLRAGRNFKAQNFGVIFLRNCEKLKTIFQIGKKISFIQVLKNQYQQKKKVTI